MPALLQICSPSIGRKKKNEWKSDIKTNLCLSLKPFPLIFVFLHFFLSLLRKQEKKKTADRERESCIFFFVRVCFVLLIYHCRQILASYWNGFMLACHVNKQNLSPTWWFLVCLLILLLLRQISTKPVWNFSSFWVFPFVLDLLLGSGILSQLFCFQLAIAFACVLLHHLLLNRYLKKLRINWDFK